MWRNPDDASGPPASGGIGLRAAWAVFAITAVGLLIGGAYAAGRMVGSDVPVATAVSAAGRSATPPLWSGAVDAVEPAFIGVDCAAEADVDAAGLSVSYGGANLIDGDATTAWRCPGTAVGEQVTIVLPTATEVVEVGLVPGYPPTDPTAIDARSEQANRISVVTWVLHGPDGPVEVEQRLDARPQARGVQTRRIPAIRLTRLELRIDAVAPGPGEPGDHTEISELWVGTPAR